MVTYDDAYEDWKVLWSLGPAADMTGGYVDSDDIMRLLESPTKKTAKECLVSQINYWFEKGVEDGSGRGYPPDKAVYENPHIDKIAIKYGFGYLVPEERRDA